MRATLEQRLYLLLLLPPLTKAMHISGLCKYTQLNRNRCSQGANTGKKKEPCRNVTSVMFNSDKFKSLTIIKICYFTV